MTPTADITKLWEFFGKELEKSNGPLTGAAERIRILGRDMKVLAEAKAAVDQLFS